MTYQPPPNYEPSNRDLERSINDLNGKITQMLPKLDMVDKNMGKVMVAIYGDKEGRMVGVLDRLGSVEDSVKEQKQRNLIADTRTRTLVAIAGFLGFTNVAGILAVLGYLSGVIHR